MVVHGRPRDDGIVRYANPALTRLGGAELLERAGRALYRAKGRGGNPVCGADDDGSARAEAG